ncbi:acyl-CoA dehydrogenase C-terminal domain-containing protein [Aeromicrobium fastidiosum]|uniref:acyl-CoA dehydrogenase C-terminal domain-containing protein n=1 Tax=Aeromicrobium fastidiosum TaxID=52699 RepID=UPI003CCC84E6
MGAAGHRVAADVRRLGVPAGLPHRAVRPRRQDRHPLRGHHGDPGPGPFFRKIVKNKGAALGYLAGEIEGFVKSEAGNGRLKVERELLAKGLEDAQAIIGATFTDLMSANPADEKGDIKNIYKVGLNTTRLVYVLGDLTIAWLLLRGAEVALQKLGTDVSAADKAFYEGKVAAASFFARNILPLMAGERAIAENIDASIMELDEAAF